MLKLQTMTLRDESTMTDSTRRTSMGNAMCMWTRMLRLTTALSVGAVGLFALGSAAHAAGTITVTSALDDGTGCSLREAMATVAAGSDISNGCGDGTGTDTIAFDGAVTGTIALASALPQITSALVLTGPGAASLSISGDLSYRVFDVGAAGDLTVSGLTITGGFADEGAGIQSAGALTVSSCVFDTNLAEGQDGGTSAYGGAINITGGTAAISDSRFTSNEATAAYKGAGDGGVGGAIGISGASAVTIDRCLFKDNTAQGASGTAAPINRGGDAEGGALSVGGSATVTVRFATFTDNSVQGGASGDAAQWAGGDAYGGAISIGGTSVVVVEHCTVANNTVAFGTANLGTNNGAMGGGGISATTSGSATLRSTLIVSNLDGSAADDDCDGTLVSDGYNLVATACLGTPQASDQNTAVDQLAAFDSAKGVLPLKADSLAIDSGSCADDDVSPTITYAKDAAGADLPSGNTCDVGAAEAKAATDLAIDQGNPAVYMTTGAHDVTIVVTVTNATDDTSGVDAHDVSVIAEIPANLTFDNAASSVACVPDGMGNVDCNLGDIAKDGSASVNLVYSVPESVTADFDHDVIVIQRETDTNAVNNPTTKTVDVQTCGDSTKNGVEECDDGDTGGDGCTDTCTLETGYSCPAQGGDCSDINECVANTDNCDANAACANTVGGFTCTCDTNFTGDGTSCDCEDGRYGADCSSLCPGFDGSDTDTICGGNGTCSEGTAGSGECACDAGWYLDAANSTTSGAGVCDETYCGDGTTAGSETCDDNNEDDDDACPSGGASAHEGLCEQASCGDGFLRADIVDISDTGYEACDDGAQNANAANKCHTNCRLPRCGDGIVDDQAPYNEVCDDSNLDDTDGCPSATDNPTACGAVATCGDGIVRAGQEGCDDGNGDNHDGCPDGAGGSCQFAVCGDGFVNLTDQADGLEACDDIDPSSVVATADGDGCTVACALEAGYTCDGLVNTTCVAECGSFYSFDSTDGDWQIDDSGGVTFAYGTTSGGATGWESALEAELPAATGSGALWRILAVPAVTDAPAPKISVSLSLDIDETGGADCAHVYVTSDGDVSMVAPQVSLCANTAGGTLMTPALTAFAGTNVYVTVVLELGNASAGRDGLTVSAIALASDADSDGDFEFKTMACGDLCVDADGDLHGDATSRDLSDCTNPTVDCDDTNSGATPDKDELCDNAFDDDCDGDIDAADAYCAEDCGDGIDNGGNGLTDCDDAVCDGTAAGVDGPDAFCSAGCLRHWSFESGPSFTQELGSLIWAHTTNKWTSSGTTAGLVARQTGRINMTTTLGSRTKAGPEPTLEVTFEHSGATNRRDLLGVCINNTDCQGNDPNLVLLADTPSAGSQTSTIDLSPWLGQANVTITILFDSTGNQPYPDVPGVIITDVKIFSDVDNDLSFEGGNGDASCDQCWDEDGDFYGDTDSPDLTTCLAYGGNPASPIGDCDDTRFSVTPANGSEPNCSDGQDNDCDGFTDAFDSDCGSEDCANLIDDNDDGNADCDDPTCANALACNACLVGYDFTKGVDGGAQGAGASAAFTATGKVDGSNAVIWQWTEGSGDAGWVTRKGNVDDAGAGRIRAWLKRTVFVPSTMPNPELELVFTLDADGSDDTFGVCFNTAVTACSTSQAVNVAWSTNTNTAADNQVTPPMTGETNGLANVTYHDGTYDHAIVEIPRNAVDVVIFYDTKTTSLNNNPGAFLAEMRVRSDIDLDYEGCPANDPSCGAEVFGEACDSCIDVDADGFGDPTYAVTDLSTCPQADFDDCDDSNPATHPEQAEICYGGDPATDTDNDCDGLVDGLDSECVGCGNGFIEGSETCDDGNTDDGDGCDKDCQVEAGALYVSEIHLPVLYNSPAEQWIELYNDSSLSLNVRQLELRLTNQTTGAASFSFGDNGADGDCTIAQTDTILPGAYYVISFGPPEEADFADITNVDAYCVGMGLNSNGDILTLTQKGGEVVDVVDFRSWSCQLGQQTVTANGQVKGRSIVLKDPPNANQTTNDDAAQWCMAGGENIYSSTSAHLGTPRLVGGVVCAELLCDGVDDDCDGTVDETVTGGAGFEKELPDADADGVCNDQDCNPSSARCNFTSGDDACSDDADGDGLIDCLDTCNDADGDLYGSPPAGAVNGCEGFEDLSCDSNPFEFPGNVEYDAGAALPGFRCINGQDDNCDGSDDCLDTACSVESICGGEICDTADTIACGDTVNVIPLSSDFEACTQGAVQGGNDKVYQYDAAGDGDVTLRLQNLGTKLYMLQISEGSCVHEDCGEAGGCCGDYQWTAQSTCVSGAQLTFPVTAGETYYVVAKQVGECSQGSGVAASLTVACSEICDDAGIDEDADGHTDCDDETCVTSAICADADWDNDGVPNGWEILCAAGEPFAPNQALTDDDYLDIDNDDLLNCVDEDDDGDGASDILEETSCADPMSKNEPDHHPAQDICGLVACAEAAELECEQANVDADCNGQFDTTEADCGVKEDNCGDGIDNDNDGKRDCADDNCIADPFCRFSDYDGDFFDNETELYCNTDPTKGDDKPTPPQIAEDPDGDGIPNCADEDDDGDSFPDTEELICGSNPLNSGDVPLNSDDDPQCDAADGDDDNDGFGDVFEEQCLSSTTDPNSTPLDLAHDADQDGTCNEQDADDDNDMWFDSEEVACETDPLDASDNPTANSEDLDGDDVCDKVDTDDDDDGWLDLDEQACGFDSRDPDSVPVDTDADTLCDTVDTDDDGDGVADDVEILCLTDPLDYSSFPLEIDAFDTDGDGISNCVDDDDDDDNITDVLEAQLGTLPLVKDTDEDGLDDGVEDANHNGIVDANETSPLRRHSDVDGLTDLQEATSCYALPEGGCAPSLGWVSDTDDDGLVDGAEDVNGNGKVDAGETNPLLADTDSDGVVDGEEFLCKSDGLDANSVPQDKDGNGVCDGKQPDSDKDGVADGVEIYCGTGPFEPEETPSLNDDLEDDDGDGDLNCRDLDDDDDGVLDVDEEECLVDRRDSSVMPTMDDIGDYDQDGMLNCADPDDDNDGLLDVDEVTAGTNPKDQDSDDDGLSDGLEVNTVGTDPNAWDTDKDGISDGTEYGATTPTDDTLASLWQPDEDPTFTTDPLEPDTDGDELLDGEEDANHNGRIDEGEGNPLDKTDGLLDTDADGVVDRHEIDAGTDIEEPDTDGDGLDDNLELNVYFTDPLVKDTDGGGVIDGWEVENGTDPNAGDDDFTTATVGGDNMFSCSGGEGTGALALILAGLFGLMWRRRQRMA